MKELGGGDDADDSEHEEGEKDRGAGLHLLRATTSNLAQPERFGRLVRLSRGEIEC